MFKEYEMSLLSERQAPLFESGSFLSQSIPYLKIRFEPLPRGSTNLKSLKQSISYAKPPSSIGAGTAKVQLVDLLFNFFYSTCQDIAKDAAALLISSFIQQYLRALAHDKKMFIDIYPDIFV